MGAGLESTVLGRQGQEERTQAPGQYYSETLFQNNNNKIVINETEKMKLKTHLASTNCLISKDFLWKWWGRLGSQPKATCSECTCYHVILSSSTASVTDERTKAGFY